MSYDIPQRVEREIVLFVKAHDVQKVILFGSRARGTNSPRSDIDIAVVGGDVDAFCADITEKVYSLLMFDIVLLEQDVSEELKEEIRRDGVIIYEKA